MSRDRRRSLRSNVSARIFAMTDVRAGTLNLFKMMTEGGAMAFG